MPVPAPPPLRRQASRREENHSASTNREVPGTFRWVRIVMMQAYRRPTAPIPRPLQWGFTLLRSGTNPAPQAGSALPIRLSGSMTLAGAPRIRRCCPDRWGRWGNGSLDLQVSKPETRQPLLPSTVPKHNGAGLERGGDKYAPSPLYSFLHHDLTALNTSSPETVKGFPFSQFPILSSNWSVCQDDDSGRG